MQELFKKNITRLQLLKIKENTNNQRVKVMVYRNHSFEMVACVINKFLNESKLSAEFIYSDYDDSLNFQPVENVDINLLWLDLSRYNNVDIVNWLKERIEYLKTLSKAKILLYCINGTMPVLNIKDIVIVDNSVIEKELGENYLDIEKQEYSGTKLSNKAAIYIARELGFKYIPSMLKPVLKAIVTDLDNTLYTGILGEDGSENLKSNYRYQNLLKSFKERGLLLAIASKNEIEDVKEMFDKRDDFILKFEDFAATSISWNSKDLGIREIAKKFNIGLDSILFIDDNIGEIEWVKSQIPQIKTLIADENLSYNLNLYPLLTNFEITTEDKNRTNDIQANQDRENLLKTVSKEDYFKELQIKLEYKIDSFDDKERVTQLLNKTNQFIFSFKRYTLAEVEEIMKAENRAIVAIRLSDKLSDSGLIGIVVCSNVDKELQIDEMCVSCRALGRQIEDIMLTQAFNLLKDKLQTTDNVNLLFTEGPRNNPAKNWAEKYFGTNVQAACIKGKIKNDLKSTDGIEIRV